MGIDRDGSGERTTSKASVTYSASRGGGRVGSWEWAERTGGKLSRVERLAQAGQAVSGQLLASLDILPVPGRRVKRLPNRLAELPAPPDSALARASEELVRELSSLALYAHCLRTWLFAAALADLDRLPHDPELLYLACVMHDLGLTAAHDHGDPTACCFAVEGARAAHGFIRDQGGSDRLAREVANAISLHLNIKVDLVDGAEAHLLHRAARLDAGGLGLRDLPRPTIAEIVGRWPRDGFPKELADAVHAQAQQRPQGRAALLERIGLRRLILNNPLDRNEESA